MEATEFFFVSGRLWTIKHPAVSFCRCLFAADPPAQTDDTDVDYVKILKHHNNPDTSDIDH